MASAHPSPDPTPAGDEPQPPTQERWWWTGTYRAVLGGAVVGYQAPVLRSGEAGTWNWVVAGVGAVVVVWGLWLVVSAYRSRPTGDVR